MSSAGVPAPDLTALRPGDVSALCRALRAPLPTPDVPLRDCLRLIGLTPAEAVRRALASRSLPAQVAARVALGDLSRLPPDPRLSPRPLPPLPRAPDAASHGQEGSEARPPRRRGGVGASPPPPAPWERPAVVVSILADNPRRPGSKAHGIHALWRIGMTIDDALAAGLRTVDVRWSVSRGHVVFGPPSALSAQEALLEETS